jgi:hypothetical protein
MASALCRQGDDALYCAHFVITAFVMHAVALVVVSLPTLAPPAEMVVSFDAGFVSSPVGIDPLHQRGVMREL